MDAAAGCEPESGAAQDYPEWVVVGSALIGLAIMGVALYDIGFRVRSGPAAAVLAVAAAPYLIQLVGWGRSMSMGWWSVVVLAPVAFVQLGGQPLGLFDSNDEAQTSLLVLIFTAGQMAATARPRAALLFGGATVAIPIVRALRDSSEFDGAPIWVLAALMAMALGFALRLQQLRLEEMAAAQAALTEKAAADERHRIAREIHDVVAHSLTVTMLHLTAARMAVEKDPERAVDALEDAEAAGRRSLADVRRIVGLFRSGDDDVVSGPEPTALEIPALIAGFVDAGAVVSLHVAGHLDAVPAPVGLAVYRIVQEAVANAVRHAPGAAVDVTVSVGEHTVEAEIVDGGQTGATPAAPVEAGTGSGLMGMRERAATLGGSVTAGPESAGWAVRCALPVEVEAPVG